MSGAETAAAPPERGGIEWRELSALLADKYAANSDVAGLCTIASDAWFRRFELIDENRAEVSALGIRFPEGAGDRSNVAFVAEGLTGADAAIEIHGAKNCVFILDGATHTKISASFEADNTVFCKLGGGWVNLNCRLRDIGAALLIEGSCDIGGLDAWVEGPNRTIRLAAGCLLAWNIMMRSGDSHAIISRSEARTISRQASILVEKHVWIGEGAVIGKGVAVGRGSIVGAKAVVTHDVEPFATVAGNPAKVVKTDVTWTHSRSPDAAEIDAVLRLLED